jgi:hypothetical protein
LVVAIAVFITKIGSRTHSDQKLSQSGGGISFIDARKKFPEHRSGLRSEKELQNGVPS